MQLSAHSINAVKQKYWAAYIYIYIYKYMYKYLSSLWEDVTTFAVLRVIHSASWEGHSSMIGGGFFAELWVMFFSPGIPLLNMMI